MAASWKTTAAGVGAILVAVGGVATELSRQPGESFDFLSLLPMLAPTVAVIINAIGNIFARDNNVTSERALADPNASAKASAELRAAGIK